MKQAFKRALITGASSGIGADMARVLAAQGTSLVLAARRVEHLDRLASELKASYGIEVEFLGVDLLKKGEVSRLVTFATQQGQTIDLLINNAGMGPWRYFMDTKLETHLDTIELNLTSLTELTHLFSRHMLEHRQRSAILNVSSVAGYQGMPRFAVYAASKTYVRVFSEILHLELKGSNVNVCCLCPGGTETEFLEKSGQRMRFGPSALMSSRQVAEVGLAGVQAGKAIIIPGLLNKLMCFFPRLLPSALGMMIAERVMNLAVAEVPPPSKD
jgi:uncharacterized protein